MNGLVQRLWWKEKKYLFKESFASLTAQIIELFIFVLIVSNDILTHSIALWDLSVKWFKRISEIKIPV